MTRVGATCGAPQSALAEAPDSAYTWRFNEHSIEIVLRPQPPAPVGD
jgi:hypothetical protein